MAELNEKDTPQNSLVLTPSQLASWHKAAELGFVAASVRRIREFLATIDARDREIEALRKALIDVGRTVGALLDDKVSTDFLMHVPAEVRADRDRLAAEVEALTQQVEHDKAAYAQMAMETLMEKVRLAQRVEGLEARWAKLTEGVGRVHAKDVQRFIKTLDAPDSGTEA